jgi:hypothetical protein
VAKINLIELTKNDDWTFESCAVCGSKEVTDLGLMSNSSLTEVDRVAWCGEDACQDDMMQALGAVVLVKHGEGDRYRMAPPPAADLS